MEELIANFPTHCFLRASRDPEEARSRAAWDGMLVASGEAAVKQRIAALLSSVEGTMRKRSGERGS